MFQSRPSTTGLLCGQARVHKGSSRIVYIIKSVHRVLFFVTPSLPKEYFVKMLILRPVIKIVKHHERHLKKAYGGP